MSPPFNIYPFAKQRIQITVEFTAKEYAEWLIETATHYKNGCIMPDRQIVKWFGRGVQVSRFVYAALKGDIPAHTVVMHTCDNNPCINPEHLEAGSQIQNALDAKSRGKSAFREAWLATRKGA